MIKRIFILILGIALLLGATWLAYEFFTYQLINPESVFVFNLDIFGILSISIFGGIGLFVCALPYRCAEVIKNKTISESVKLCWIFFAIFASIGLMINYTNYFVNIKGKGFVNCEFHSQRSKDWMLNKYARTQEDCEKEGGREVSK